MSETGKEGNGNERRSPEVRELARRVERLEAKVSGILNSRQWKAADRAVAVGGKVLSRPWVSAATKRARGAARSLRARGGGKKPTVGGGTGRLGPRDEGGIQRVQVGCGPHNIMEDWWNVDIDHFPGIDEVMDATKPWPYKNLDYVFGEHFLEHLALDGSVKFLSHAGNSLRTGGTMRLSTPNLKYVLLTHYTPATDHLAGTLRMNRAFHGWGHRFLYTREMLEYILNEMGFEEVSFFTYGESGDPALGNLERHGKFKIHDEGEPSVIIAEARKGEARISATPQLASLLNKEFLRYLGVKLKA